MRQTKNIIKIVFILMLLISTISVAKCESIAYDHAAPDPSSAILYHHYYYIYTTTTSGTNTLVRNIISLFNLKKDVNKRTRGYIPIIGSKDLSNWKMIGYAFNSLPKWSDGDVWSPEVVYLNHKFILYYAAKIRGGVSFGIGVAISESPVGPFIDLGHPIVSGKSFEAIDPDVFIDGKKTYLLCGSDFGPIYIQELSENGTKLVGKKVPLLWPTNKPYERLIEGAFLIQANGYYYLFYCGDNTWKHYAEMVARSKNIFGPYERYEKNPILKTNKCFSNPGGASLFKDEEGRWWIVYHAYKSHNIGSGRIMMLKKVVFKDGWPKIEE